MKPADRAIRAYQHSFAKQTADSPSNEDDTQVHKLLSDKESGVRKAAKFLLLLPKDQATEILRQLDSDEVERVAVEIARVRKVEVEEARKLLDEFGRLGARGGSKRGGPDTAREMLIRAFGEERGGELFEKSVPTGRVNPFDFLDELEFHQILMVLKHEPASVVSVVLPHIQPDKAAQVLEALHPDLQRETALRISRMEKLDPQVLGYVAEALRERIRKQGNVVTEEVDGRAALAEILRYLSPDAEAEIIDHLGSFDQELSQDIQERLLTIDVVFRMRDADFQAILRDYSEGEIATILKGKTPEVRSRFFSNMSDRRGVLVREEMERLGPMKRSEVGESTRDFLLYIRDLADEGRVVIDLEDEYLVD